MNFFHNLLRVLWRSIGLRMSILILYFHLYANRGLFWFTRRLRQMVGGIRVSPLLFWIVLPLGGLLYGFWKVYEDQRISLFTEFASSTAYEAKNNPSFIDPAGWMDYNGTNCYSFYTEFTEPIIVDASCDLVGHLKNDDTYDFDDPRFSERFCDQKNGHLIITFTASDDCGNSSACTQSLTSDNSVGPTIICPSDSGLNMGNPLDHYTEGGPGTVLNGGSGTAFIWNDYDMLIAASGENIDCFTYELGRRNNEYYPPGGGGGVSSGASGGGGWWDAGSGGTLAFGGGIFALDSHDEEGYLAGDGTPFCQFEWEKVSSNRYSLETMPVFSKDSKAFLRAYVIYEDFGDSTNFCNSEISSHYQSLRAFNQAALLLHQKVISQSHSSHNYRNRWALKPNRSYPTHFDTMMHGVAVSGRIVPQIYGAHVLTTYGARKGCTPNKVSGTSFATPHVTRTAALWHIRDARSSRTFGTIERPYLSVELKNQQPLADTISVPLGRHQTKTMLTWSKSRVHVDASEPLHHDLEVQSVKSSWMKWDLFHDKDSVDEIPNAPLYTQEDSNREDAPTLLVQNDAGQECLTLPIWGIPSPTTYPLSHMLAFRQLPSDSVFFNTFMTWKEGADSLEDDDVAFPSVTASDIFAVQVTIQKLSGSINPTPFEPTRMDAIQGTFRSAVDADDFLVFMVAAHGQPSETEGSSCLLSADDSNHLSFTSLQPSVQSDPVPSNHTPSLAIPRWFRLGMMLLLLCQLGCIGVFLWCFKKMSLGVFRPPKQEQENASPITWNEVLQLIKQAELEQALLAFEHALKGRDRDIRQRIILLQFQLQEVEKEYQMSKITFDQAYALKNKIAWSTVELLTQARSIPATGKL